MEGRPTSPPPGEQGRMSTSPQKQDAIDGGPPSPRPDLLSSVERKAAVQERILRATQELQDALAEGVKSGLEGAEETTVAFSRAFGLTEGFFSAQKQMPVRFPSSDVISEVGMQEEAAPAAQALQDLAAAAPARTLEPDTQRAGRSDIITAEEYQAAVEEVDKATSNAALNKRPVVNDVSSIDLGNLYINMFSGENPRFIRENPLVEGQTREQQLVELQKQLAAMPPATDSYSPQDRQRYTLESNIRSIQSLITIQELLTKFHDGTLTREDIKAAYPDAYRELRPVARPVISEEQRRTAEENEEKRQAEVIKNLETQGLHFDIRSDGLPRTLGIGSKSIVFLGSANGGVTGLKNHDTISESVAVAVKVPSTEGTDPAEIARILVKNSEASKKEATLLETIRRQEILQRAQDLSLADMQPQSFVPDATLLTVYDQSVLAMELIPDDDMLLRQQVKDGLGEKALLHVVEQYSKFSKVLNSLNLRNGDLKAEDFRLVLDKNDPTNLTNSRFVILDWNVIQTGEENRTGTSYNMTVFLGGLLNDRSWKFSPATRDKLVFLCASLGTNQNASMDTVSDILGHLDQRSEDEIRAQMAA